MIYLWYTKRKTICKITLFFFKVVQLGSGFQGVKHTWLVVIFIVIFAFIFYVSLPLLSPLLCLFFCKEYHKKPINNEVQNNKTPQCRKPNTTLQF